MSRQNKRSYQNNNKQNNQSTNHADNNYPVDSMNDVYESYGQSSVKRNKNNQKHNAAQNKNESNCR